MVKAIRNLINRKEISVIVLGFIVCIIEFLIMEYSAFDIFEGGMIQSELLLVTNFAIITLPNIILVIIFRNYFLPLMITSIFFFIWSIVNYYVILFHGSPLSASTLLNITTAINVVGGYRVSLDKKVLCLICLFLLEILLIIVIKRLEKKNSFSGRRVCLYFVVLIGNVVFLYLSLFSSFSIKPAKTIGWSWNDSVRQYGYMCYLVEDAENTLHPVTKPAGYNVEVLPDLQETEVSKEIVKPDIILILNESFFDLGVYANIETDTDYLEQFYNIENAIYGYAISPMIGGGTNNSEYELLTSNSMYLLNADAPFNYLDLKKGSNFIRILNSLGYETCGMHCAVPTNYSRNKAYPVLGMEHVILGKDQFKTLQYYGNRPWLDLDNYQDMIDYYENLGDGSRFVYLLTYQNHGGYEQNSSEFDTVHIKSEFGELTDDINEYMTSMQMSAEAIHSLVDYFSESDRQVILCMLGDHAPSFIADLPAKENLTEKQREIAARSVPYMLWANFDMATDYYREYIGMVDVAPIIMKNAGLPLTVYGKSPVPC